MVASVQARGDVVTTILEELKGGDPARQAVVIAALREMPGEEITKAIAKELPNLAPAAQVQLLSALGDRGDAVALPAVIAAAKATDEPVRVAALKALGQLGDANSVMLLAQTAAATGGDEQKAARESLYQLRGTAGVQTVDETILMSIPKADTRTKVELISSIGERNITAGVKTLLETTKDPDRSVRLESLKVLKIIAGSDDLPALVEILLSLQSDSDRGEAEKTIAAVDKNSGQEPPGRSCIGGAALS